MSSQNLTSWDGGSQTIANMKRISERVIYVCIIPMTWSLLFQDSLCAAVDSVNCSRRARSVIIQEDPYDWLPVKQLLLLN